MKKRLINFIGFHPFYSTAWYSPIEDKIYIEVGEILSSGKLTEEEKQEIIGWQIDHEMHHYILMKHMGDEIATGYDYVWQHIHPKWNLRILRIAKKLGWR